MADKNGNEQQAGEHEALTQFDKVRALDDAYVMHTYGRLPVEFVAGNGAELTDSEGKVYLDFLAGIGCVSLGHADATVVAAVKSQLDRVWQVGNYYHIEHRRELARALSELLSTTTDEIGHVTGTTGSAWKSFFANSGAEANEGAIKVARRWGERELGGATGIVSARKSFHGRTLATLAATGQDIFHKSFGPFPEGFRSVSLNDIDVLRDAVEDGGACAVMLECVQGEGGVWPADFDYLRAVRELCDEHRLLLVIDEVQTGFFRCGAPFAFQMAGIEADVVSMAKGIASGFPMGAVAARAELGNLLVPGDHGSTFGGNALAAAAGLATVRELVGRGIGEHVIATGAHLAERLSGLPHVGEVRGRGLMRGIQLDVPIANELVSEGLDAGLVLNHIGDSILRFLPPLVVSENQVDTMVERLAVLINRLA